MPEVPGAVPAPEAGRPEVAAPEAAAHASPAFGAVPDAGEAAASDAPEHAVPVDDDWRRVSPKFVIVEVVGSLIGTIVFVGAFLVAYFWFEWWWALWAAIAIGVLSLVAIAFEPRRVRSIGYRLRADDLLFRRGIMYQRQVAVPYGRMQLVDVTRGPVARALGLADLKFVTAAAATAVTVPGLPIDDAERLRDELVALAETRRAGL